MTLSFNDDELSLIFELLNKPDPDDRYKDIKVKILLYFADKRK